MIWSCIRAFSTPV